MEAAAPSAPWLSPGIVPHPAPPRFAGLFPGLSSGRAAGLPGPRRVRGRRRPGGVPRGRGAAPAAGRSPRGAGSRSQPTPGGSSRPGDRRRCRGGVPGGRADPGRSGRSTLGGSFAPARRRRPSRPDRFLSGPGGPPSAPGRWTPTSFRSTPGSPGPDRSPAGSGEAALPTGRMGTYALNSPCNRGSSSRRGASDSGPPGTTGCRSGGRRRPRPRCRSAGSPSPFRRSGCPGSARRSQ